MSHFVAVACGSRALILKAMDKFWLGKPEGVRYKDYAIEGGALKENQKEAVQDYLDHIEMAMHQAYMESDGFDLSEFIESKEGQSIIKKEMRRFKLPAPAAGAPEPVVAYRPAPMAKTKPVVATTPTVAQVVTKPAAITKPEHVLPESTAKTITEAARIINGCYPNKRTLEQQAEINQRVEAVRKRLDAERPKSKTEQARALHASLGPRPKRGTREYAEWVQKINEGAK